jgi:hypothetical protein
MSIGCIIYRSCIVNFSPILRRFSLDAAPRTRGDSASRCCTPRRKRAAPYREPRISFCHVRRVSLSLRRRPFQDRECRFKSLLASYHDSGEKWPTTSPGALMLPAPAYVCDNVYYWISILLLANCLSMQGTRRIPLHIRTLPASGQSSSTRSSPPQPIPESSKIWDTLPTADPCRARSADKPAPTGPHREA